MYCILSQLNILCTSLLTLYYTKMKTGELCNQNGEALFVTLPDQLLKSGMVFRVHSRHVELLLTY